ncbi:unnamed protein product [Cylindrotheca closterium]|uniref:Multicopper oxidase n=1 Tax=Cylindrotheca closterium TaxID=2856 RepID=A0AAD2FMY0_9STRA|nr:unnamed protein product [Cylindrotheca closterium]
MKSKSPLMLIALSLLCSLMVAEAATDYISCDDPCNGGDVNYDLVSTVETVKLMNYTYRGRFYKSGTDDNRGIDGFPESRFMGPTMRVKPGQSLWIKLSNEMDSSDIGPTPPTAADYWVRLQKPGEAIKYKYYQLPVDDPSRMLVDTPNIPGHFDSTNLHVHGLDVEVHMFDPVGTHNPDAPHIKIDPGECYCYKFNVPEHHPEGQYWYHPHLHGSSAVQLWGGMFGLLHVDGGTLESELGGYGITTTKDFVIWDPAFQNVDKDTHNIEVDEFLEGQTTLSKIHPFLVNGEMNPTFETATGQVLHLRVLCATIENENTFIVYEDGREEEFWDDAGLDFWVIGVDGVMFRKPSRKHIAVLAGGQRNEILLQFDKPGNYVIRQHGIDGMQFFGMRGHPHNQTLATIRVTDDESAPKPSIPIDDMIFTPGYDESKSIQAHELVKSETIVFSMGADRNKAPFPQYFVNGKAFSPDRLDFLAHPGEAREYVLINGNHNVHPFHIHVNRFQVIEMGSELSAETYPVLKSVMDFEPGLWRDTVVLPPNGRARIWVKYGNHTGKTLFHCHFLAHEDTGMMSTLFIGEPDFTFSRWKVANIDTVIMICVGATVLVVGILFAVLFSRNSAPKDYSPVSVGDIDDDGTEQDTTEDRDGK